MYKTLIELKKGEQAEVVSFEGGHEMSRRLEGLGVRPGKIISRISSQLMAGPVTICVDGRQTAMGRGIASKVRVKMLDEKSA